MKLSEGQKTLIKGIMRDNGVAAGYVFGSYARGTAGPISDIDVGVAFKKTIKAEEDQSLKIESIRSGLEKIFGRDRADVVNLGTAKNPLIRYAIVIGEGEELFADDRARRTEIVLKALRDYEDTKRLRLIKARAVTGLFD